MGWHSHAALAKAGPNELLAEMVSDQPEPIQAFKRLGVKTESIFKEQEEDHHGNT